VGVALELGRVRWPRATGSPISYQRKRARVTRHPAPGTTRTPPVRVGRTLAAGDLASGAVVVWPAPRAPGRALFDPPLLRAAPQRKRGL